ncbi:hypothetical protein LJX78_07795 [Methanimicrococcus blatticola]|uniref:hypothetical protein n=1 Tax=Methanimicrococcus blatticola TaxID=91560 RepID=UPI001E3BBAEA|nr:hypothetical protein [Methanimicrococcus blatticola]MCC2509489.1 hypothetical protein [Methanimicrococcus blatticola]
MTAKIARFAHDFSKQYLHQVFVSVFPQVFMKIASRFLAASLHTKITKKRKGSGLNPLNDFSINPI